MVTLILIAGFIVGAVLLGWTLYCESRWGWQWPADGWPRYE